jgi:hypothetical protein
LAFEGRFIAPAPRLAVERVGRLIPVGFLLAGRFLLDERFLLAGRLLLDERFVLFLLLFLLLFLALDSVMDLGAATLAEIIAKGISAHKATLRRCLIVFDS